MQEYEVVFRGPAVRARGVDPVPTARLVRLLDRSVRGAVDMAFRRSSGRARRPRWLANAGRVEWSAMRRIDSDAMRLDFAAMPFGEVAAKHYERPSLFEEGPAKADTAFDIFADAVRDVVERRSESDRFDAGLLRRFDDFGPSVFAGDFDKVTITGHRVVGDQSCRIGLDFSGSARALFQQTPKPARVKVAGRLDLVEVSTRAFGLLLPEGVKVRGVWCGDGVETLRELLNTDVVANGMAVYRPSGSLLRLDAETLTPQRPEDRFFAVPPHAAPNGTDLKALLRGQRQLGGMAAVWGAIPAEESDEEFLAAVQGMV
jgi:hypothetical protein